MMNYVRLDKLNCAFVITSPLNILVVSVHLRSSIVLTRDSCYEYSQFFYIAAVAFL